MYTYIEDLVKPAAAAAELSVFVGGGVFFFFILFAAPRLGLAATHNTTINAPEHTTPDILFLLVIRLIGSPGRMSVESAVPHANGPSSSSNQRRPTKITFSCEFVCEMCSGRAPANEAT